MWDVNAGTGNGPCRAKAVGNLKQAPRGLFPFCWLVLLAVTALRSQGWSI